MKPLLSSLVVGLLAAAITSGCASSARARPATVTASTETEVNVTQPMPPLRVESVPVVPGAGMNWVGGYWTWSGSAYTWNPGQWLRPTNPGDVWIAPRDEPRAGGYVYVAGRWSAPHLVMSGSIR